MPPHGSLHPASVAGWTPKRSKNARKSATAVMARALQQMGAARTRKDPGPMDSTTLVSLSNQLAMFRSMDTIANNVANASTPGFKREESKFEQYLEVSPPAEGQTGPQITRFVQDAGLMRDIGQGQLQSTGDTYDLAISGKGYFVIQTPQGNRYTRDGHFTLNADGQIVTADGNPLIGDGGPINISPDDGEIAVGPDGTVTGKQGQIAKVQLVDFPNERALIKQGANLYTTTQQPTAVTDATIKQGMLEQSNVSPVLEITNLIDVSRAYQLTASLAQSASDLKREAVQKLGSPAQG